MRIERIRRSADSNVPSPMPAQRNCRGEGRVRGGKFSSAACLTKFFRRTTEPPFVAVLTTLLVLLGPPSMATEISIVVPNEYENVEGNSGGSNLSGIGFRALTIFAASEFESLPDSNRYLKAIAFRPNVSIREPRTSNWGTTQWFLSTTSRSADDMSTLFSENHGSDKTTVFDGPLVLSTQATGPADGPRDFDYRFELERPFFYDPSRGNLVVDFIVPDGFSPALLDDQAVRQNAWLADFPLSGADSGSLRGNQLILELTFVPEPSGLLVLVLGTATLIVCRRDR